MCWPMTAYRDHPRVYLRALCIAYMGSRRACAAYTLPYASAASTTHVTRPPAVRLCRGIGTIQSNHAIIRGLLNSQITSSSNPVRSRHIHTAHAGVTLGES